MNKRVAVIMIRHPEHPELILHGKRRDNGKMTCPGGHLEEGESPLKGAYRELFEETGIKPYTLTPRSKDTSKDIEVHLFEARCPEDLKLRVGHDPDSEFEVFSFINPEKCDNLHIPKERNILLRYLKSLSSKDSEDAI